jgi:di/tricarboxylate transporter
LGVSPQAFVLATVIGASTSFLTPVGHQANVLVLGPGGYRFFDYTRVGLPLNIVLFVVTLLVLPILWPL